MPDRAVVSSTPGKLILMGEHAAVHGRPALVAALGLRLTVRLEERPGRSADVDLPGLGYRASHPWAEVLALAHASRERWRRWAEAPTAQGFRALRDPSPAHLVLLALGEAAGHLGEASPGGLALGLRSALPVGSGCGSSAAAAVGIVAAYLALRNAPADPDTLHRLSLEVERRQHGTPSGVDNATVIRGGVLRARRLPDGSMEVESVAAEAALLGRFALYDSGPPAEPTGEVVAAVGELARREPARFEAVLDRLEAATGGLRALLEGSVPPRVEGAAPARVAERIREAQRCLEELGVVPEPVRALVRRVEAAGFAAKISGAGSLAGPGAGSLLVYDPSPDDPPLRSPRPPGCLDRLPRISARLGAEAVRLEEPR